MLFANHPGDGWHWLHPECMREFFPVVSEPVHDHKGRFVGAILEVDGVWSAYRYHSRAEGMLLGTGASKAEALRLFDPRR